MFEEKSFFLVSSNLFEMSISGWNLDKILINFNLSITKLTKSSLTKLVKNDFDLIINTQTFSRFAFNLKNDKLKKKALKCREPFLMENSQVSFSTQDVKTNKIKENSFVAYQKHFKNLFPLSHLNEETFQVDLEIVQETFSKKVSKKLLIPLEALFYQFIALFFKTVVVHSTWRHRLKARAFRWIASKPFFTLRETICSESRNDLMSVLVMSTKTIITHLEASYYAPAEWNLLAKHFGSLPFCSRQTTSLTDTYIISNLIRRFMLQNFSW